MKNKRNHRAFFTSFFCTLLLLALLWGLAVVDFQCRRIGFGDNKTFLYEMTGKNPDFTLHWKLNIDIITLKENEITQSGGLLPLSAEFTADMPR